MKAPTETTPWNWSTWKTVASTSMATAVAAVIGGALLAAPPAKACGGFFCSNSPVDQNAERILFEVHPPPVGVTAVVEIAYTGDPGDFSWIVPVPETPNLDVVPTSALRLLDNATAPRIINPPVTCEGGDDFFGGGAPVADAGEPEVAEPEPGGVVVEDLPVVGAFDPEVISSDDPNALVEWLNDNNYLITPAMEPFIAQYVADGYKFLGLKLTPDSGVSDIAPIKFSCPNGEMPLVPIRLTGVSAEPEMGVLVFVAGEQRYAPQNFRNLVVDTDMIQVNPRGLTNNYYPLVSWLLDNEGGKAFVTEHAAASSEVQPLVNGTFLNVPDLEESRDYITNVLDTFPYVTRMYTRMSGWEMTDDPPFAPSPGGDVSRVHDLSERPPIEVCAETPPDIPCGNTYCGVGALCATTADGVDGCVCNDGTAARQITAPVGAGRALRQTVVCQDSDLNLLAEADIGDPCDGYSCGDNGRCQSVNGFATCACDAGFAAIVDNSRNRLLCSPVQTTYAPEQLLSANVPGGLGGRGGALCACVSAESTSTSLAALGLIAGLGLLLRRRRD